MADDARGLADLLAKDEIRDLAQLYSRGVDRKDIALLRTLYTSDGIDLHGPYFRGSAIDYVDWLAQSLQHVPYSGHHICNHLISVQGEDAEGEVYAIAFHILPDGVGGHVEDLQIVRYLDRYRKEEGRWRFAQRVVSFDLQNQRPIATAAIPDRPEDDLSYGALTHRLFARA